MCDKLFRRLGHHYILVMMILTRVFGSVGGLLVIYYVELTLELPAVIRHHFRLASVVVVIIACTLTVLLALWETRTVRRVLERTGRGLAADVDQMAQAGRQMIIFLARHHWHETWLVPLSTLLPVLIVLRVLDGASLVILGNITLAVFMGIAIALMSTFFIVEYCMQPVIRHLLDLGVAIEYESLPAGKLRFRFRICFTLIIITTALMIGTMARQRASDIIQEKDQAGAVQAVAELRKHSSYITVAAVLMGAVFSTVLANSVASRVRNLVEAMERVRRGNLAERVHPTGNDEIDNLARQFNAMVRELEHNDHTIRDLNTNLEGKVSQRTSQLQATVKELRETQTRLTDLAHHAGMAEIATGVLHNVGNVLNSVNISTTVLRDRLDKSKLDDLGRFTSRLRGQGDDLPSFFATGQRAGQLLEYMTRLSSMLDAERAEMLKELESLNEKVGHIKGIINTQQQYARRVPFRESVELHALVGDVLEMHSLSCQQHRIEIVRRFDTVGTAHLEKSKLLQVLDNVVKNAVESMASAGSGAGVLTVEISPRGIDRARISISDTGGGIAPEHLKTLFTYGFTTKRTGNGFGLHSSALAIADIGGTMLAHSDGEGKGATFILEFPLAVERERDGDELASEGAAEPAAAGVGR